MQSKQSWCFASAVWLLGTAPVLAQSEDDVTRTWFQMFFTSEDWLGRLIIAVLLLASVVVIAFTIQLSLKYRRITMLPQELLGKLQKVLEAKRYREAIEIARSDKSYLGKVAGAALMEANNGYRAMEQAIEEVGDAETVRILRPIEYLNVIGNIAPMMGLFGTVYGMIRAFEKLREVGGRPDPGELAAGISTALVTTFWGLVVAMPALTAYAIIRNKIDAFGAEGMIQTEALIRPFKPSSKRSARSHRSDRSRSENDSESVSASQEDDRPRSEDVVDKKQ